ncbi:hypothetical protein BHM03_00058634 [Ensete ventricosum]|uniref:HTH myb-type domain-containing protein n=1 Tax=Ensete ventricosum TaxID=4639 RepID=A0A445MMK5_ENSVE|nr:hypothetical protein BHM03_00058634 [Ensete ventricosum]
MASCQGLNRTGKSCRLRWLNYLRPDVRRGNITPGEQQLIMELHAKALMYEVKERSNYPRSATCNILMVLDMRWSKIARQLPGRTDNEIKNFWRTRIQKKLKHGEAFDVQNVMLTDEASTSTTQVNTATDEGAQPGMDDEQRTANPDGMTSEFSTESSDNFWTVDDFWSMPSLTGD